MTAILTITCAVIPGMIQEGCALTFETAHEQFGRGQAWIQQQTEKDLQIDLSQVTEADSAGVALLIEWMRCAKQKNSTVRFINLSDQFLMMVRANGLENIISL